MRREHPWHTEDDTLEIADRGVLKTDIEIYTLAVLRHARAEILPDDWRLTASEFVETVERYDRAAGDAFDLSPARDATYALRASLTRFHDEINADQILPGTANAALMRLARVLIPINFSPAARFLHGPAYVCPPLPDLAIAMELERHGADSIGFAKAQLTRGQNRYLAALAEASHILDAVAQ